MSRFTQSHEPQRFTIVHPECLHAIAVVLDVDPPPRRPSARDDRAAARRWRHDAGLGDATIRPTGIHDVAVVMTDRPGCPCKKIPGKLPPPGLRWVEVAGPSPAPSVPIAPTPANSTARLF